MVKRRIPYFSLAQICRSGQCFRMYEKSQGCFYVIAGDRRLEMEQEKDVCTFYCGEAQFHGFWEKYFDLECNYGEYIGKINPRDTYLVKAADAGQGIRILRQDLWEMTVSFLISQQNNIARIRRCVENICQAYGEERQDASGENYYGFPSPGSLAVLDEDALMACNLGYRSRYVVRAARAVVSGALDLEQVKKMPYKKARGELLKLFGVGEKVADCICLFALHHLDAFPVDTHMHQALEKHYKRGFPNRRYRGIRGVVQQYMFYYETIESLQ